MQFKPFQFHFIQRKVWLKTGSSNFSCTSFALVKSLGRLTDGKMNLILPLRVGCKCMLNGDAKETPRKETWAQEWGPSEDPSNWPNSEATMVPAKHPVTEQVTSSLLSSAGQSNLTMKNPDAGGWADILVSNPGFSTHESCNFGQVVFTLCVLQFHHLYNREGNQTSERMRIICP